MRTNAVLAVLALALCACPVRPKDGTDSTDDGAGETTRGQAEPVGPDPQTAEPGPEKAETEPAKPAKLAPMERGLDPAAK